MMMRNAVLRALSLALALVLVAPGCVDDDAPEDPPAIS
jgi:hypothetical protein